MEMGWKACAGFLIYAATLFGQNVVRHHDVTVYPFNGTVGKICFEEPTGGNKICLRAVSMASDITMDFPSASSIGSCLGWTSASTLGNLACSGGTGITGLGSPSQTGANQTFSKVDDTNVTLTITSGSDNHQFALGWTGALAKARQNAATVYNDQSNTYTGGNQDFGAASLKLPSGAGVEPTTEGYIGFNTTTGKPNIGRGGGVNNGLIQGPDVTNVLYLPVWNDIFGRELSNGYRATDQATTSTVVLRSIYGGAHLYDAGAQVFNIKAYGAAGDGVSDDTSEILATITACEDSARGGTIYVPPGIYGISGGLWHGNGASVGGASTKATCKFLGAGPGDDQVTIGSANANVAAFKWIGSNPGSLTYMLTLDGPIFGTGVSGIKFDANNNSNVVGIDGRSINFSHFSDVSISQTGGGSGGAFAFKIWPQKSFGHFACYNTLENVRVRPYTGSGGSALWVGGNSTYGTACSINVFGGYFNRDNDYTSGTNTATYGALLDSSDNFHATFTHFSTTGGNGLRNGCSIGASVGAYSGAGAGVYPDSAHFYGISSEGMCGTTGSGRPFVVWGGECGAGGGGSCDYHNAFTGGGTRPISLSGESDAALKGVKSFVQRNGDGSGALYHQVISTTGTELYSLKRGAVTGSGLEINGFNEIQFKNPSFVEGHMKVKPESSSSPGACNSTNEGWFWVKAASGGVATTLTMCAANSSGVYDWRTVATF